MFFAAFTFEGFFFFSDRVKKLVVYFGLYGYSLYFLRRQCHEKLSHEQLTYFTAKV